MTMSIPQKMLIIHPTMITAVSIWMKAAATLSQNTQHTPRSEISSLRAPHSTVNAEMKVPTGQTQPKHYYLLYCLGCNELVTICKNEKIKEI